MCLAFIAFTFPGLAQSNSVQNPQDTVHIRLQGRNQVLITGISLKYLADYQRADTLKALFFADLKKSLHGNTFPETPKRIHYFVNQQGKRRMKAEINEDAAAKFDLDYEKTRMLLDLPPLHYTIYDLPKNVEMHFYLEDSTAFEAAAQTGISPAIQLMNNDRKKLSGLTAYRLENTGFGFESRNPKKRASIQITTYAYIGATLIGNQLSPVISYDMFLNIPANSRFRLGFSYNGFVLTDFTDGQFRSVNPGMYWQGILQFNFKHDRNQWMGLSAGQISNLDANGFPENVFKGGIITHYNRNSLSLDAIFLDNKETFKLKQRRNLFMLTYRRTIF